MINLLYFQIQYNIIVRTGHRTYPRYFKLEFAFHRAKYQSQPRPINPAKLELQAQVIKLRLRGWSFPAIAKHLDIVLELRGVYLNKNVNTLFLIAIRFLVQDLVIRLERKSRQLAYNSS